MKSTLTMSRPVLYLFMLSIVVFCGCNSESDPTNSENSTASSKESPSESIDFDAMLTAVDNAIGKRFQATQMESMNSASYQYDGPIKTVVDIVDPIAKKARFSSTEAHVGEAEKEMQAKAGVKSIDQMTYTHPCGDFLTISRMDVSIDGVGMKLLLIQLMNPEKMYKLGLQAQKQ